MMDIRLCHQLVIRPILYSCSLRLPLVIFMYKDFLECALINVRTYGQIFISMNVTEEITSAGHLTLRQEGYRVFIMGIALTITTIPDTCFRMFATEEPIKIFTGRRRLGMKCQVWEQPCWNVIPVSTVCRWILLMDIVSNPLHVMHLIHISNST